MSDPSATMRMASGLAQVGRFSEALTAARRVLRKQPNSADVLGFAAACALQLGEREQAARFYERAVRANNANAELFNNLGNVHAELGRTEQALTCYERALTLQPNYVEAAVNLALLLYETKQWERAEPYCLHAIAVNPMYARAHYVLALVMHASARIDHAEASFRRALELAPESAETHNDYGNLLRQSKRLPEAARSYQSAARVNPGSIEAYQNLGAVLLELERPNEAARAYRLALALRPDDVDILCDLGEALVKSRRFTEAEPLLQRAITMPSASNRPRSALALALISQRRYAEAEALLVAAIASEPESMVRKNNLANLLIGMGLLRWGQGRLDEAERSFRSILSFDTDCQEATWNLALLQLLRGHFEEGWQLHEVRLARREGSNVPRAMEPLPPGVSCPLWKGEPLVGKELWVWPEQGYGDEIQFIRYLPALARLRPAKLVLVCKPPLTRLLRESVSEVDAIVPLSEALASPKRLAEAHYWVPIMSLPERFGTRLDSIPAEIPYLRADKQRVSAWKRHLPDGELAIGLVWKGNPDHVNDMWRSIPHLDVLAPLWEIKGVRWVSLQKGAGEEEARQSPLERPILLLGEYASDFADLAAMVSCMDLVICVDTAVAHLAGALGKRCWLLLPIAGSDWRWLLDTAVSPWYPGQLRLFRQRHANGWDDLIREVAQAVREHVADSPGQIAKMS